MKTLNIISVIITAASLFSPDAIANNLPKSNPETQNIRILAALQLSFFENFKTKNNFDNKEDTNSSKKLVYISDDNSFIIFQSNNATNSKVLGALNASKVEENNDNFQNIDFRIFNNPLNPDFKLDRKNRAQFYFSVKNKKSKDIYESRYNGKNWAIYQLFENGINSKNNETSACLSDNGKTLFFTSDRKGGYGGLDIWKSEKLENGDWGPANNLGPEINTALDEESPFLLADNVTMYFSSKGHNSHGGFDVYNSTLDENGTWTNPVNIGFPINTNADELHFKISSDERNAFYSSSKSSQNGGYEIMKTLFNPNFAIQKYIESADKNLIMILE
ncbi:MAG: PD40 domain-containing protein [Bacteroidetes bacterium]|nr:PD40 domain-containing protein [Bacteroidota bacterium]